MDIFPTLDTVLSHGYLTSGFLLIQIAFPALATILLRTVVPETYLLATLLDTVSCIEANLLKRAMQEFTNTQQTALSAILSRFGTRQPPTVCYFVCPLFTIQL